MSAVPASCFRAKQRNPEPFIITALTQSKVRASSPG